MFCVKCGGELPDDAEFCSLCHTPTMQPSASGKQSAQQENSLNSIVDETKVNVVNKCPYCGASSSESEQYCSLCNMPLRPEAARQFKETKNHNVEAKQSSKQPPRPHRTYGQKAIIAGVVFVLVGLASAQQKNSDTSLAAGIIQLGALCYMLYCGLAGFIKGFKGGISGSQDS